MKKETTNTTEPTIPVGGYDGNQPTIRFCGLVWTRSDYGEYDATIGRHKVMLRAIPNAGPITVELYWVPDAVGSQIQREAHGLAAVTHKVTSHAAEANIPLVFKKEYGEAEVVWPGEKRADAPEDEDALVKRTIAAFESVGVNVPAEAIRHNIRAWSADLKSGYRAQSIHLFSPCGCNNLAFRSSPLRDEWADWQTTYTA